MRLLMMYYLVVGQLGSVADLSIAGVEAKTASEELQVY